MRNESSEDFVVCHHCRTNSSQIYLLTSSLHSFHHRFRPTAENSDFFQLKQEIKKNLASIKLKNESFSYVFIQILNIQQVLFEVDSTKMGVGSQTRE